MAAEGAVEWHVNFADPQLFGCCGSGLLAQYELRVAEHPVLGALREALDSGGQPTLTVEDGRPTPFLVAGVERRCHLATNADAAAGRPHGLYGNRFAAAEAGVVRRATSQLYPPTRTNLIAMAAPAYGTGRYTAAQIEFILTTAYTGFRAAIVESARLGRRPGPAVVHSGFCGCGVKHRERESGPV